jgi:hypothetical protein
MAAKALRIEVSSEQRAASELVKRIRKLRWIGLDDDADRVQAELNARGLPAADSVIAMPRDTD